MKIFASLDLPLRPNPATGLVGRQVANATFLEALLRYSDFDQFHFFPGDNHDRLLFERDQEALWNNLGISPRVSCFSRFELPGRMQAHDYHVFHQSDFVTYYAALCQLRSRYARARFPVTSPIHSISYPSYMEVYVRMLLAGPESYDAIVCTSRAGRTAVAQGLAHASRIPPLDRLNISCPVRLEHIPLGVEIDRYHPADAEGRLAARKKLHLPLDATIALCLGRFSESDKYDLVPLLQVFQQATKAEAIADQARLDKAYLVLAGARQGNNYPERLEDLANQSGLTGRVKFLVDVPPEQQRILYQAADIFVSPSDNIQETFGLTIVEAMASGLPVLASDWDGYKDLVVHGETGLLVPTYAGGWDELLGELGPLSYQRTWHLAVAQGTIVDSDAMATDLRALILNPIMRMRMGTEGRRRSELFDWQRVIQRYMALWQELKALALEDHRPPPPPDPFGAPPFSLFSAHATGKLPLEARFALTERGLALLRAPNSHPWYRELDPLFDATVLRHLCARLRLGGSAEEVIQDAAETYGQPPEQVNYQLHWLIKQGFLSIRR